MIDGLSESSRALLDAARQGLAPDAAAVKRVHAKIAAGGLVAGIGAKLLVLALLATAGGVAVIAARHGTTVEAPAVELHEVATIEVARANAATTRVESPPPPAARRALAAPVLVVVEHHADLAREVALIDAAMTALATDPAQALATIQIFDAETAGHGQMAEDAAAIAIEAHCKLHDAVTAQLATFDARWPGSAQRTRVTEACK